ncbi:MAG TPA: hypothetical protein VJ726_11585 [Candidatus Limnocylindria bacterium]|nr:hypothetical protein [Candidatus Limnocylindria bacterium]
MDDPRLVALGLVPPPPGQEKAPEAEWTPAAPEAPPATPDWQPAEQSQYLPGANPFSEAANTIPQYPDPFTTPLPPATPPAPAAPPPPAVPSIFNSPNSPFAFAPPAAGTAPPPEREYTTLPDYAPAPVQRRDVAPNPFASPNSPFSVAAAPTTFTPAAPVAAPTTKQEKKAALKAIEEAKKAAKIAEENAEKAAKIAAEDAKRNAKLAEAQAKIDEREAKIAAKEAKKAAEAAAKAAKRGKLLAPEVTPTAPFVATPFVPPAPTPVAKPFAPAAAAIPVQPPRTQPYMELMAAIGKHPAVIKKDVQYGYFGRARIELSPMGFALVGLRSGTAYTWNEVKDIRASRGRLEIKTEADRERTVKTKESTTIQPYVEKVTRALVISIDGATEPGFAPYIAKVMQDMKAQTFNYHATSWLEYENALERVRGEFAEHDDPFVPAVAGALFAFIFVAGLFILPEIVNLASDIKPPAGAFVVQPRYGWFDIRSFVMAIGLSALLTRLVLRLGLGSSALSWARGSVRGWHTSGPLPLRIASRELARLLLGTSFAAAALFLGFAAFAPTVASTLVIDSVGLREVVPLPLIGVDKKWSEVSDVQKSEGPGRLEGFGVTVFFRDGRWVTTVDHDLPGGTDGQLYQRATSWWKTATE